MRLRSLLVIFLSLLMVVGVARAYNVRLVLHYTVPLSVYNKTDQTFYFGTCKKPIYGKLVSLCGLPQKVEPGLHMVFVPPFQQMYPVFTTPSEKVYTCGTQSKPRDQLPITSQEIVVDSFILDKNQQRVALKCVDAKSGAGK